MNEPNIEHARYDEVPDKKNVSPNHRHNNLTREYRNFFFDGPRSSKSKHDGTQAKTVEPRLNKR